MKVLVTGASGFIGSHTVGALLAAGHEVRASARSVDRVDRALQPHGWHRDVEPVAADMLDRWQVTAALNGCDAVVHAAAVFSHDPRRARQVLASNRRGAEVVLGAAAARGLATIVHVSSYVVLLPAAGPLDARAPAGHPSAGYARSKAEAELVARRLRERGAPVTVVRPGLVFGPDDPSFGESTRLVTDVLRGRVPMAVPGTLPVVDVRDVARVLALAATTATPRQLMVVAEVLPMARVLALIAEAGGRRPPRRTMPPRLALAAARLADAAGRVAGTRLPMDHQSVWTVLHGPPAGVPSAAGDVPFRPAASSLADAVRWVQGVAARDPAAAR